MHTPADAETCLLLKVHLGARLEEHRTKQLKTLLDPVVARTICSGLWGQLAQEPQSSLGRPMKCHFPVKLDREICVTRKAVRQIHAPASCSLARTTPNTEMEDAKQ